jgi:hypothetical protein
MVPAKTDPPRLSLLLAKTAPVAVIIARVRAKLFHVMKWQYKDNVIEHGSWFEGSFYPDSSDVSFDGRHLVYFALNPKSGTFSWTAVCEPPFLKALAFWEHDSTWYGGGYFPGAGALWLYMEPGTKQSNRMRNVPSRNIEKIYQLQFPADIKTEMMPFGKRMARDGWMSMPGNMNETLFKKASPDGKYHLLHARNSLANPKIFQYQLFDARGSTPRGELVDDDVSWADWDAEGLFLHARKGVVTCLDLAAPGEPVASIDLSALEKPEDGNGLDKIHVP